MQWIRDSARVRPADAAWAFALRAGLAVAFPLVTLTLAGHPSRSGIATFGSFAALYARDAHYRSRGRVVAAAGLGLVACVVLGTLVSLSPSPALPAVVAVSLVGAAATWLAGVFRVGPPAGLMFAFATAVAAAVPARPADVARNAALTAAAAAVAWVIAMAGAAVDRDGPRRLAVARALRRVAAARGVPESPAGLRLRHQAATAVARAWDALPAGHPLEPLVARAESALAATGAEGLERDRDELMRLAGAVPRRGPVPTLRGTASESAEITGRHQAAGLAGPPYRDLLRRSVRSTSLGGPLLVAAARVAAGALVAGALAGSVAHATGMGHAYWASVSAVAVLQGANLLISLHRGVQRAAGTVAGLLVAVAAVAAPGGTWTLVAGIIVAQVAAELLVIRNYGLAMVAVTPLALLVGEMGHPGPPAELLRDRLVQTVLGCVLGLLGAVAVRTRTATRHLEAAIAACTATTARLGAADHAEQAALAPRLARELTVLREAYDVAAGEPGLPPGATQRVLDAERRGRLALARLPVSPAAPSPGPA
ncbi:FUSC family protein [Couchioplanes caeruleus]|uniref:FUSC family protein n=1 Tax=Couchioplanes caeruleus TaxID=56438 RepID=UPI0020BE03BB|nr:FUSC family protein [Couchioplanes caeruleus]UQU62063.1 FUSC family protein [Couchioplanes caeruleus]